MTIKELIKQLDDLCEKYGASATVAEVLKEVG